MIKLLNSRFLSIILQFSCLDEKKKSTESELNSRFLEACISVQRRQARVTASQGKQVFLKENYLLS